MERRGGHGDNQGNGLRNREKLIVGSGRMEETRRARIYELTKVIGNKERKRGRKQ